MLYKMISQSAIFALLIINASIVLCDVNDSPSVPNPEVSTKSVQTKPTPVVLWHGMGSTSSRSIMDIYLKVEETPELIERALDGAYVKLLRIGSSQLGELSKGFFMDCNEQVKLACELIRKDKNLENGYHAVGFSQGGLFLRGLAQRCPSPPMVNLVTVGSPHQGIYGVWCSKGLACGLVRKLLTNGAYSDYVQGKFVQAQFWHDPLHEDIYRNHSSFLADINNERSPRNLEYSKNLNKIKTFVLVQFDGDTVAVPKESQSFGWYAPGQAKVIQAMNETRLYREDWIGLRELDESGRLKVHHVPGNHQVYDNDWFVKEIVMKYLR